MRSTSWTLRRLKGLAIFWMGVTSNWGPDGRFLAVKREPSKAPGVAAVRIEDGAYWPVVAYTGYVPLSWGEDENKAMALALRPINGSAVLAK